MELRGLLVIVAALLFASAAGAESPAPPAPQRLGRPVLQPPGGEERQTAPPAGAQQPGGTQEPGSKRLGRPVLAVPPPGAKGARPQQAPGIPHPAASPNGSASSEGPPR